MQSTFITQRSAPLSLGLYLIIAAALGFASGWMPVSSADMLQVGLKTAVLFLVLWFFIGWLPRRTTLPMQIMTAMIVGVMAGWVFPKFGAEVFVREYLGIFGRLFILMLTLVIIPLIFVSVLNGTAGIGDPRKLGSLGLKSLVYYFCTTSLAVLIGLALVNMIQPGHGREALRMEIGSTEKADWNTRDFSAMTQVLVLTGLLEPEKREQFLEAENRRLEATQERLSPGMRLQEHILPAVIRNPVMAGQNPIVIIFFAIVLGAALAALGKEGLPALHVFQSLDKALITIILWVMRLAPIGVFALMARAVSELGIEYMLTLAKYFGTVMLGLGLHFCVLTFLICPVFSGVSPLRFLRGMAPAFQLAFSTSSSSATLPVTIECASKRVGADPHISSFMLPVGATINMDGTALYLSVACLFIAQVYGMQLGFQAQFMVFLTAVLASVGTAGIPGASIGLITIILSSANIPVEGIAIVIGVDRLLDMTRTVVNITGDSVGVMVVSKSEGLLSPAKAEPA